MFTKNRIMIIHTDEMVLIHLNGREIACLYEVWDGIDAFAYFTNYLNKMPQECRQKDFNFISINKDDIDVAEEAETLLYDVKQFTQEEEKAFFTSDWKKLNELLLQRIEDGNIE